MSNRYYNEKIMKALFAKSGNKCSFPDCCLPIVEDDNNTITGQICHIEAESINGPRYNCNQSEKERNSIDNLVLMCARHHKIIDSDEKKYTVELIKDWKYQRELSVSEKNRNCEIEYSNKLKIQMEAFWNSIKQLDEYDDTGLKRKVENECITDLIKNIEQEFNSLLDILDFLSNSDNGKNWEMCNLAIPNVEKTLQMNYFQLLISLLEELVKNKHEYEEPLIKYRAKFMKFQDTNYYTD